MQFYNSEFSLQIFSDSARQNEILPSSTVYIGSAVYAATTWKTPVDTLNYYLDSCTVQQGTAVVQIIKDNCYSKALGAKLDQATHKVDKTRVLKKTNWDSRFRSSDTKTSVSFF